MLGRLLLTLCYFGWGVGPEALSGKVEHGIFGCATNVPAAGGNLAPPVSFVVLLFYRM